jgi:ankyrin repeat protein
MDMFCTLLDSPQGEKMVNQADLKGNTPLHMAFKLDNIEAVKILLEKKADYKLENKKQQTPLHLAAE